MAAAGIVRLALARAETVGQAAADLGISRRALERLREKMREIGTLEKRSKKRR
jgi:hypothetical protein